MVDAGSCGAPALIGKTQVDGSGDIGDAENTGILDQSVLQRRGVAGHGIAFCAVTRPHVDRDRMSGNPDERSGIRALAREHERDQRRADRRLFSLGAEHQRQAEFGLGHGAQQRRAAQGVAAGDHA
jgi:hypothetical protein